MKSKQRKTQEIEKGVALAKDSKSLILIDFSRTGVNLMNELKRGLREINAVFTVMKKTLFSIVFEKSGIDVDAKKFPGQVGAVFGEGDIVDTAGTVFRFAKEHKEKMPDFTMIAGYDIGGGVVYDADTIMQLGRLPSREVLLTQVVSLLISPMRSLAVVLNQIAKAKGSESSTQDVEESQETPLQEVTEEKAETESEKAEEDKVEEPNVVNKEQISPDDREDQEAPAQDKGKTQEKENDDGDNKTNKKEE